MPITILEAMSLGKVIISVNVGGIGEWVRDEMNGLLVERENPRALAGRSSDASPICNLPPSCARARGALSSATSR